MTAITLKSLPASAQSAGTLSEFRQVDITHSVKMENRDTWSEVDSLMKELASEDPSFGQLLVETGRELAPLASDAKHGDTITSLRMSAGLTQQALAEKTGMRQSNISLLESGRRTNIQRDTMVSMCSALGCDMNTLNAAIDAGARAYQERLDLQEVEHQAKQQKAEQLCA